MGELRTSKLEERGLWVDKVASIKSAKMTDLQLGIFVAKSNEKTVDSRLR